MLTSKDVERYNKLKALLDLQHITAEKRAFKRELQKVGRLFPRMIQYSPIRLKKLKLKFGSRNVITAWDIDFFSDYEKELDAQQILLDAIQNTR